MSSGHDIGDEGRHDAESARSGDDEAECWRNAARLRREFPAWVVIWIASSRRYRAYRMSSSRRDSALTAETPDELTAQITRAEQASNG